MDDPTTGLQRTKIERVATILVTFTFAINAAFAIYMLAQFFFPKPYSTAAHIVYSLIAAAMTVMLGYSAHFFWHRRTQRCCHAFFAAIGVSFAANAIIELYW